MDSNINPITCQLRTKFSHLKMEIIIVPSHRVLWLPLHSISSPASTPATWTLQTIVGLYTFAYSAPLQFTCPTSLMQDLVHSYPLRSSLIVFNKHIWFSWAWHVWRYFLVSFVIGLGLCDKIWSMLWVKVTHVSSRLEHLTARSRLSRILSFLCHSNWVLEWGWWCEPSHRQAMLDVQSKKSIFFQTKVVTTGYTDSFP